MSGAATTYVDAGMLGHTLGFAPMTQTLQVYVGLCAMAPPPAVSTGGSEISGGGYTRAAATFALTAGSPPSAANTASIEFARSTGAWGTLGYFELWDAPTGGNRLYWGAITDPNTSLPLTLNVLIGEIVRFSAGTLVIQTSALVGAQAITVGPTPPTSPIVGALWWDSTGGNLYVWYTDPSGDSMWVTAMSTGIPVGPYVPTTGGVTVTGPITYSSAGTYNAALNYIATGGTALRSLQSRAGEMLSATDFGIVCDGVTDQGAALNTALASMAPGTTLYIPGSIYTSVTILVNYGRKLEMPPGNLIRPSGGPSTALVGTIAIIGAAALSPVVQVGGSSAAGNEGGLINVWITRNGTPPSGAIGLQVYGQDHIYTACRFYNHAIGAQIGGFSANPAPNSAITTRFDHCVWWNCSQHYTYIACAPETTFIDCRWGITGATDPIGATALVTIDGDNNNTTAASPGTLSFVRCQFNTNAGQLYTVRFYNVATSVFNFSECYSGGSQTATFYVDPSCHFVQDLILVGCSFGPLASGETFLLDTSHILNGLKLIACGIGPVTPASFYMSGNGAAIIIGNTWHGGAVVQLDSMNGGCFIGNSVNTMTFTGVFTGSTFTVSGNAYTTAHTGATGAINYETISPTLPLGSLGYQATGPSGNVIIAQVSATSGAIHFAPSAPAAVWDIPFYNNYGNNLTAHAGGGQANATQITTQTANVTTCVTAGDSVKLPQSVDGLWQVLTNNTGVSCQVFGTSPDTINGIATGTGYALAPGKTLLLYCYAVGAWQGGVLT